MTGERPRRRGPPGASDGPVWRLAASLRAARETGSFVVPEGADEALLDDGRDVRAVSAPDLAEAQRPAGRGRRAVVLVEEPLVGAHRRVEPDRVVEAGADEPAPAGAEPGDAGREQGQVAGEGQRRGVHRGVVGQVAGHPQPGVTRCAAEPWAPARTGPRGTAARPPRPSPACTGRASGCAADHLGDAGQPVGPGTSGFGQRVLDQRRLAGGVVGGRA